MKKIFLLVLGALIIPSNVFAWGWGSEANCPYSKNNQQNTEEVENSDKK